MNKTKKSKDYITIIKYSYNEYLQNYNYNKNTTRTGSSEKKVVKCRISIKLRNKVKFHLS